MPQNARQVRERLKHDRSMAYNTVLAMMRIKSSALRHLFWCLVLAKPVVWFCGRAMRREVSDEHGSLLHRKPVASDAAG